MRKILYNRQSPCLQPLRSMVEEQSHLTLVLWALDCAKAILPLFATKYGADTRPKAAIELAYQWAHGAIKMPAAKQAAHAAHAAATAVSHDAAACAAARAIGHAIGTVHVETHALGVVFYGLTAWYYWYLEQGQDPEPEIAAKIAWFEQKLSWWQQQSKAETGPWAEFLLRPAAFNKEKLLHLKNLAENKE